MRPVRFRSLRSFLVVCSAYIAGCASAGTTGPDDGSSGDSAVKAGATVTIDLPVTGYYFENNREVAVDVPKLNKELNQLGLDGIPEVVTMGKNPGAFHAVILKRVQAANEKLGRNMIFNVADDGYSEGHLYQWEKACYKGNIEAIPALIKSLRGNFLYEDESVLGIRAGAKEEILDDAFKSKSGLKERFGDEYENNERTINSWLNYKKTSKTALIMSDLGPNGDGTELYKTEIPPCP
jgi:hypothetical protein